MAVFSLLSPFTIANLDSQITFFDLFWYNFRRLGVCVIGFPSNPDGGQLRSETGMDTAFMAGLVDVAGQGLKKTLPYTISGEQYGEWRVFTNVFQFPCRL